MADAIVYCDRCGRLVPPSDLERGAALRTPTAALCVACTSALGPAERAALERVELVAAPAGMGPSGPARRTPAPRPSPRSARAVAPKSAPRAGLILALGGGFGLGIGVVAAVAIVGARPSPQGPPAPPPIPQKSAEPVSAGGPAPGPPEPAPDDGRPAVARSARLEAIRSMLDPSFSKYEEVVAELRRLLEANGPAAELEEAKKLLAEVESGYAALAEAELEGARKAAGELASRGRRSDAISVVRLVATRFAGSEWYRTRGEREIASALAEVEKAAPAEQPPDAAGSTSVPLTGELGRWDFTNGPEFPGAAGSVEPGEPLRLRFDFSGGGTYVAAGKRLAEPREIGRLSFRARGDPANVNVRLLDATGQCLQYRLGETSRDFREYSMSVADPPEGAWGGSNDKKVHQPVREIWLCAEKRSLGSKGTVEFADLRTWGLGPKGRVLFDVTFDADEPDARPAVASFDPSTVNRWPTGMSASETETVLVRRSSGTLTQRPVELASRDDGNRAPQLLFELDRPVLGTVRVSWESAVVSYGRRTDGGGSVETAATFRLRNRNTDPLVLVSYVHDSPDGTGGVVGIDCVAPEVRWTIPRHEARWKVGGPPDRFTVLLDMDRLSVRVWRNDSLLVEHAGILKERVLDGLKGLEVTDGWAVGGGNGSITVAVDNVKITLGAEEPSSAAPAPRATAAGLDSDPALVAWWRLDDAPGSSTAADSSGRGFAGTLVNMDPAVAWVEGRTGGALRLDGVDDYVSAGDVDPVDGASELTVAAWVKVNDLSRDGTIVAKGPWGATDKLLFFRDDVCTGSGRTDTYKVSIRAGANEVSLEGRSGACADSGWHHVAFTFVGGRPTGLRLYVDGVEDPNGPVSTAKLPRMAANNHPLQLGRADTNPLNGVLDDVRIYARALSAEEIAALYASAGGRVSTPAPVAKPQPGALDTDPALIGWWPLDDGPGSTKAADASGKCGPGTLVNMDPAADWVAGKLGMALNFDGTNDWVNCGNPQVLASSTDLTVAAWVRPDDTSTHLHGDSIVSKEGGAKGFQLTWHWTGRAGRFSVMRDGASNLWGVEDKLNGTWYHAAFTQSGGTTRLYVNGVEEASGPGTISPTKELLTFGSHVGADRWLRGQIDDVRIYTRALSAREIAELHARADEQMNALARTPEARARLARECSASPASEGYYLSLNILANLRQRFDKGRVTPKKLAAIGGAVASNLQFDASLRGGLRTGEGYTFAGRLGLADSRLTLDAIRKGLARALERERPELVRIVPDIADIARGRTASEIRSDLEAIANAVLDAGAVPVLFTPAAPKSTGDKKADALIAAAAEAVRGAARALNLPYVDAFALLNAEPPAGKKYFGPGLALARDGFDLIGARFLALYRVLETWVMERDTRPAEQPPGEKAQAPGPATAPGRLVPNGGFEEVLDATRFANSWTAHQWGAAGVQYSVRLDRSNTHSGERSLVVQAAGEGALPGAFTTLAAALEPGRYELRFWASADVGKTAQVHANLAGKDLGPFTVDEDWKQIVRAIEVDERKPGAVLRLWTSTPRVRVWFDDVSLEKLP